MDLKKKKFYILTGIQYYYHNMTYNFNTVFSIISVCWIVEWKSSSKLFHGSWNSRCFALKKKNLFSRTSLLLVDNLMTPFRPLNIQGGVPYKAMNMLFELQWRFLPFPRWDYIWNSSDDRACERNDWWNFQILPAWEMFALPFYTENYMAYKLKCHYLIYLQL